MNIFDIIALNIQCGVIMNSNGIGVKMGLYRAVKGGESKGGISSVKSINYNEILDYKF